MTDAKTSTLAELGHKMVGPGMRLVTALLMVFIGLKIIKAVRNGMQKSMKRAGLEITLTKFLDALLNAVLTGILIFMAAEVLEIKTTSLVTIVGAFTLALSLAMQNTLSNFAGGVMVLFLKPFKVGDYIKTSNGEGTVEAIGLVYTTLLTLDNRKVIIPNSSISSAPLTNFTGMDKRRLVLNVGIGYSSDLKKAKQLLQELLEQCPAILKEDGIMVAVESLGESSVGLTARGWLKTEDYWPTKWKLTEEIKLTFDREGIEIPYNYLNVCVSKDN